MKKIDDHQSAKSRYSMAMELKAEIQETIKSALKKSDHVTRDTLRLLLSAVHNEEIKVRRDLTHEEIEKTISGLCKQRKESIDLFRKGGRIDLAQKEEAELVVLQRFLPAPLTDNEIRALIRASMEELGAKNIQDLGRLMKQIMPKVTGRNDGKRVNELAREMLGT